LLNGERGPGDVAVQMSGISKRFGAVQALHGVDLELRRGEILGLVGDNGAGKSTLMKILNGALIPDEGHILVTGSYVIYGARATRGRLAFRRSTRNWPLFNNLDVAANVFSGRELTARVLGIRFLRRRKMEREAGNPAPRAQHQSVVSKAPRGNASPAGRGR